MNIDKILINSFVKSTERAAYGASNFKGKKIKKDSSNINYNSEEYHKKQHTL